MSQNTEIKMDDKTVLVVFPSIFSLNKIKYLMTSIVNILKIKDLKFNAMRKNGSVIVLEVTDPVLASSAIGMLFGVDRIAIAKEVKNNFNEVLSTITRISMSLLLKGEKFFIKVDGKATDYLTKDLEVATTASLIEKSAEIQAKPGSEFGYDRLLYTYLTESYAYVCIFLDKGMGGVPHNSQNTSILCPVYDELSAISCLQCIKMGFNVNLLVCYSSEPELLKLTKIISRILPALVRKKIKLQFYKMPRISVLLTRISLITHLTTLVALDKKISRIALAISPFVFPTWFIEGNTRIVSQKNLTAWFPLTGIDSSIMENAKEIGLEKYLSTLESLCRTKFTRKIISENKIKKIIKDARKNLKSVQVTIGPKNVHDIIDSLKANH